MKKGGGSEATIIIGPSKSVLVPQLSIRPRPCPISDVRAKLYIYKYMNTKNTILCTNSMKAYAIASKFDFYCDYSYVAKPHDVPFRVQFEYTMFSALSLQEHEFS